MVLCTNGVYENKNLVKLAIKCVFNVMFSFLKKKKTKCITKLFSAANSEEELYLESSQHLQGSIFAKIVNCSKPLTIFAKKLDYRSLA